MRGIWTNFFNGPWNISYPTSSYYLSRGKFMLIFLLFVRFLFFQIWLSRFAHAPNKKKREYFQIIGERIEVTFKLANMLENYFRPQVSDEVWNHSCLDLFENYLTKKNSGIANFGDYSCHVVSVSYYYFCYYFIYIFGFS